MCYIIQRPWGECFLKKGLPLSRKDLMEHLDLPHVSWTPS